MSNTLFDSAGCGTDGVATLLMLPLVSVTRVFIGHVASRLVAMHDCSRLIPDKSKFGDKFGGDLVCKASDDPQQVGTIAKDILFRGRVELDQLAPHEFVLTDTFIHEVVKLPHGVWRIESCDDVPEIAILGQRLCDGDQSVEEEELDMLSLFERKAYKEPTSGGNMCVAVCIFCCGINPVVNSLYMC